MNNSKVFIFLSANAILNMNNSKVFMFSSPNTVLNMDNYELSMFTRQNRPTTLPQNAEKPKRRSDKERLLGFFTIYSYPLTDPEVTPST